MFKTFSVQYAGWIDMENIGLEGTPVNDRTFSNEQLASVFEKSEAIARGADRWGYDTLWMAEHHFQPEGYECVPNLLMLSVHLVHLTERLRFGCAFNISPMWHPLRLAEDFAMADILTNGRVIFGVGRGYHTREVETFGVPMIDADANREIFEEQVEIILKAFNEDSFSHKGEYYTIPPRVPYRGYELEEITLVPRPVHRPVEIWQPIVSGSARGMDFMAKYGIKGAWTWSETQAEERLGQYRDGAAVYGRELRLGEDLSVSFVIHLEDSHEKAMRSARPYFEENLKMFAPLGFVRGLTDEQLRSLSGPSAPSTPGLPTLERGVQDGRWLVDTPENVIARLKGIEERYPALEHIGVGCTMGSSTALILEQIERFAKEVMPAFIPRPIEAS